MINQALLNPKSIAVVGGSNDVRKPGGKVLKHLIDSSYNGRLLVVNPKESRVQGIQCLKSVEDVDNVDLAILSIPAKLCPDVVEVLSRKKNTKAFIILSAGFGEAGDEGKELEKRLVQTINETGGCLIGPNCIGVLNANYSGIFTSPVPQMDATGCDLISSSGATAVFIMEAGIPLGLKFSQVLSIGNGAQIGIEEVLEYMDIEHNPQTDSGIKLLYFESLKDPKKFLKHTSSLIQKGVKIAAIKAGSTDAGSRAAASHTGALSNSDAMVRALFRKAGIVYCSSREELLSVGALFNYKELTGKNIAIITHAGGSAVMLSDALASGGLEVPEIEGENAKKLLSFLHAGSSIGNPIDFLATGTAEQLGIIIDYCECKFDQIDAMIVVFGSPGLFDVENVYNVLSVKLDVCKKPIYPVLPSVINAQKEIKNFLNKGHINFPDEVVLGRALSTIWNTHKPQRGNEQYNFKIDRAAIRLVIDNGENGFLPAKEVGIILDALGINRVDEYCITNYAEIQEKRDQLRFPLAMKVVGPIHKSDIQGVKLNINSFEEVKTNFEVLMEINDAEGVLIQPMISGVEIFAGLKRDEGFGHLLLCGLGGVFIEILNDFSASLIPIDKIEAKDMIRKLKGYKLFEGVRGKEGVDEDLFTEILIKLSMLAEIAPEISELDINPFLARKKNIVAVDARIQILK